MKKSQCVLWAGKYGKFDTQLLTVAFLDIDLEERMKYKIK
jgi:hypothetical protein